MIGHAARLRGVPQVLLRLRALNVVGVAIAGDELRATIEGVATASRRLVPVDTGALRDSIQTVHENKRGKIRSEVGAGDTAVFYAVPQHEDTTLRHPGQGQAKYIEAPFNSALDGFESALKSRIRRAMRAT